MENKLTATAEKPQLSQDWPLTLFHQDGVRTMPATDENHYERLMSQGCWVDVRFDPAPPPPPPAEEPETPEEKEARVKDTLEGLDSGLVIQEQKVREVEDRLSLLEANSHPPFDSGPLMERIDKLEQRVDGQVGTASGTWARLKVVEDSVGEVKASMDQAAPTLARILERLEALETKKSKQQ
jgi:uncharacterized coiled-coil protein SlyX